MKKPWARLEAVADQWGRPLRPTRKAIRERVLFHPRRIPVAGPPDWSGATYLDLIPGAQGTEGQLLTRVGASRLVLTALSFRAALERHFDWLSDDTATVRGR